MNEVKKGDPHISDLGYGGFEAGHMWAEPKNDQAFAFYLDANFEKTFKIDDISSVFHYELINDIGGLNSCVTGEGKDDLRFENLDGMLNEDKIANLPTISLTEASEDYVLDVDFSKKVPELDYQFCEELSLGNTSSEIHSSVTSSEVNEISKSCIPEPKCCNNQFGNTTCGKMRDVSEHKCGYETAVEDGIAWKCSHTCDLQNANQRHEVQSLHEAGSSFDQSMDNTCSSLTSTKASCTSVCNQDDVVFRVSEGLDTEGVSTGDLSTDSSSEEKIGLARQRRLCKPPKRYMEGSLWFESRLHKAMKSSGNTSTDKDRGVCSQMKHRRKEKDPEALETYAVWELNSDDEYDPPSSKFQARQSRKKSYKKKTNNLWTLDEVVNLVEGLAQFGIGQWTAVKKAYFNSSYRSATDIRDKWRNLVKSNCKNLKRKQKDDQHQRNGAQLLPKSVVERVRELATSHPVPRGKSRSRASLSC